MICYIILTFSAVGDRNNVISPSEMIFFNKKIIQIFFLKLSDLKGTADIFYMHTYLTLT